MGNYVITNETVRLMFPKGAFTILTDVPCCACGIDDELTPIIAYRDLDGYLNRGYCEFCLSDMIKLLRDFKPYRIKRLPRKLPR